MKIPLQEVAGALGVALEDSRVVTGWSVDSRTTEPGDLFFALRGPNHDAHLHLNEAFTRGALAAVVEREVDGATGPLIRVTDSLEGLQRAAAFARRRWGGQVIGITGSAGKTTTKDAVAAMLSVRFRVGKTTGNFNNHVGVPLSLLRLADDAELAVIEIGMNHAGEIRELSKIAAPRVGVVTNVGTAHIENFDSIEDIALAKRELVEALPPDGIAVLNVDDPRVLAMAGVHPGRVVTYGLSERADFRAESIEFEAEKTRFRIGESVLQAGVAGRHGVSNLLAGIAVASLYGISAAQVVERVRDFEPGKMRGQRFERGGILIIDDCYNANPDAVRATLDVLRDTPAERRIAVLGEMLELGRWAEALHRDVGNYAAKSGVNVLVGIRGVARQMVDAAIDGGLAKDAAFFFDEPEPAGLHVRALARPGDAILFKGSRGTHVEKALEQFLE